MIVEIISAGLLITFNLVLGYMQKENDKKTDELLA